MFSKVLETAFRGCGVTYAQVRNSRRFIEYRSRVKRWSRLFPRSSDLGALLRAGPLRAGSLLNNHSFPEAVERARGLDTGWSYDPEILAAIDSFGHVLLDACVAQLPQEFAEPQRSWAAKEPAPILTRESFAERWRSSSPEERRELGEQIMLFFRDPDRSPDEPDRKPLPQSVGAGVDHVLPMHYGRWTPGVAHGANCLGRAQLTAAFAESIGVRTLSALPMLDLWHLYAQGRSEIARRVIDFYDGAQLPLKGASRESLEAIRDFVAEVQSNAQMHHMTVALDCAEGEWMLVDPNFNMKGDFNASWDVDEIAKLCDAVRPALPGFSRLVANKEALNYYAPCIDLTDPNCGRVLDIARQIAARPHTKHEIVEALSASPFLREVLRLIEFELDMPRRASARKKAICVLLEYLLEMRDPIRSRGRGRPVDSERKERFLWFVFAEDYSEEQLLEKLGTDEDANAAFQVMVLSYAAQGLTTMSRMSDTSLSSRYLQHPVLEFADTRWGLAAATLSHVGQALGLSSETTEVLNRHTFRQRELVYAAGAPLISNGARLKTVSRLAAGALHQAAYRSYGARHVLHGLSCEPRRPEMVEQGGAA